MRRQFSNSIYGLLDYAAYPIGMLFVAPFILVNLGVAQYGVWTVTNAVVNIGAIVASGFGDANVQKVANQRGAGRAEAVLRVVRASLGIHVLLGIVTAIATWCLAPVLSYHMALQDETLRETCLYCVRIASILTAIRAIETVCISTQRAFERYGAAVGISIAARLLSLAAAAILASREQSVAKIMGATAAISAVALVAQIIGLQRLMGRRNITPSYDGSVSKDLLRFGAFTWVLAASGVVFSQADRLIGGTSLGATAVVSYALCAQLSQPVYGLTAAGLHFLFPYIACRRTNVDGVALKKKIMLAIFANIILVLIGAGLLLAASDRLLRLIATEELARMSAPLLPPVLAGSTLLALSVAGCYAMIALGRVRTIALLNVTACAAIVVFTGGFLYDFGIMAIAGGRIAFALIVLCIYIPLASELRGQSSRLEHFASSEAVEGV